MESGFPPETARVLLESEMSQASAETKDSILDSLRSLDDVVSDEVVPALAILAREYLRANRGKDRFLVGLCGCCGMLRTGSTRVFDAL